MRCWFHKWLPWSQVYERKNLYVMLYQHRTCKKCNKV